MTGHDTRHQSELESISLLQELDLGWHTLFLMSDGSIDVLVNDSETPSPVEHALHLDSDETYRLFILLHELFKQQNMCRNA